MEATISAHPSGYEVRVYMGGDYLYSFLQPTRELAEYEADELKREKLAKGWTDRFGRVQLIVRTLASVKM